MKKSLRLPLVALLIALTPALVRSAEGDKPKPEETELGKSMDVLSKAWRKLRKQAADPTQNASSLELLATVKGAATKNLDYTPDLAKDIPADKRDQFVAGYQKKMKEVIAALGDLETAFKANDNKAAGEIMAKISALQKEGHKEYKRPE